MVGRFPSLNNLGQSRSKLAKKVTSVVILGGMLTLLSACSHTPAEHSKYRLMDAPSGSDASSQSRASGRGCASPYRVVWGDTLSGISVRCHVRMQALADANDLFPPYRLYVNQELIIPGSRSSGSVSQSRSSPTRYSKKQPWQWPVKKELDYRFLKDSAGLNALEIYGPPGLPVKSVQAGEVVYAGGGIDHFGLMVMIKHPSGYISTYAHNSALLVKEGESVKVGQVIATLGGTGATERPKLYFEARYRGRKVDVKKLF